MSPYPPRGLRWTDTGVVRTTANIVAFVALLTAVFAGIRQQVYVNCVADQQRAQAMRTSAIATATDAERRAQRALITAVGDERQVEAMRAAALAAYDATDAVRKAHPAPPPKHC